MLSLLDDELESTLLNWKRWPRDKRATFLLAPRVKFVQARSSFNVTQP